MRGSSQISGFQDFGRGVAGRQQGLADGTDRLLETVVAFAVGHDTHAGAQGQGAVGNPQNIGKTDVLGRPAQGIAAGPAAMTAHDAGLLELQQNGLKEFAGNLLAFGDFGDLDGRTFAAGGQVQQGAQGVTGFLRNNSVIIPYNSYGI